MSEIDTALGTEIVKAIRKFKEELGEGGGLQHISAESFGKIVADYASALIDQQMYPSQGISVEEFDKRIREITGL